MILLLSSQINSLRNLRMEPLLKLLPPLPTILLHQQALRQSQLSVLKNSQDQRNLQDFQMPSHQHFKVLIWPPTPKWYLDSAHIILGKILNKCIIWALRTLLTWMLTTRLLNLLTWTRVTSRLSHYNLQLLTQRTCITGHTWAS